MKRSLIVIAVVLACVTAGYFFFGGDDTIASDPVTEAVTHKEGQLDEVSISDDEINDAGVRSITGTVVDANDAPVVGARVTVTLEAAILSERVKCHLCGQSALDCTDLATVLSTREVIRRDVFAPKVLAQTVTDQAGQFHFEGLPELQLVFSARSSAGAGGFGSAIAEAEQDEVGVTVYEAKPFEITVTSEVDGATPPPARVMAYDEVTGQIFDGRTDHEGKFVVTTPAQSLWVSAEADGFLTTANRLTTGDALTLSEAHTVIVHTVRGSKPIEAEVVLAVSNPFEEADDPHAHHAKTINGTARFENLPFQAFTVGARAGALMSAPEEVSINQPETQVTIDLEVSGRLMLSVVDEAGDPVPFVTVSLMRSDSQTIASASSQDKGELIVLGPVPQGAYSVTISTQADAPVRQTTRTVEVLPGDTPVEVVMTPKLMVSGRVLTADGKPVLKARVNVRDELQMQSEMSADTDDDGVFMVEVPEVGVWKVLVTHKDGATERLASVPGPPLELRLEARAGVHLVVADEKGAPVEGATIVVQSESDRMASESRTDARGEVTVLGLPRGTSTIYSYAKGYLRAEAPLEAELGRVAQVRLTLDTASRLAGTVVDESGAPVSGAIIAASEQVSLAYTQTGGLFSTEEVAAGKTYTLHAQCDGYEPSADQAITVPSEGVQFRLKALPKMTGRVVTDNGAPLGEYVVNNDRLTNPDGRFSVAKAEEVAIAAKGYRTVFQKVPPGTLDLGEITLAAQERLSGLVVDAEGRPAVNAQVSSMVMLEDVFTDAKGEFTASIVEDQKEPFEVSAFLRRYSARTVIKPGQGVTLRLVAPTKVHGKVLAADGRGRAVTVFATGDREDALTIDTSNDGLFTVELKPGRWLFSTRLNQAMQAIQISGDSQEVVLGAPPGTCGVVIDTNDKITSAQATPTSAGAPADPSGFAPAGTVILGPGYRAGGIPCGEYDIVAEFETGPAHAVVSVRGEQTHVAMKAPDAAPAVPFTDRVIEPVVESTPPE